MPRNHRRTQRSVAPQLRAITELPAGFPLSVPESDAVSLRREKLDFHAELFEAAQVQRRLSGPRALRQGDMQFATEVFAAHYLSGDFVTLNTSGSVVFTALGDIAGKGLAAGMWFTNLVGLLQRFSNPGCNPAIVAAEINRHLCCLRPGAPFVTMFLAQVDCVRGELVYCSAGHFPPVLLRADGSVELLEKGGPLLGALANAEFEVGRLALAEGDTLVAYSDGVLECRNPGNEEFGMERLTAEIQRSARYSAKATLLMLLAAVQDFANGSPLCDDASLMVIQRDRKFGRSAA